MSFTCHCGNTGVERTPNKEPAYKVDSEEENYPAAPAGIRTRNLSIASPAFQPISDPGSCRSILEENSSDCSIDTMEVLNVTVPTLVIGQ